MMLSIYYDWSYDNHWSPGLNLTKNWKENMVAGEVSGRFHSTAGVPLSKVPYVQGDILALTAVPQWLRAHICHVSLPLCGNKNAVPLLKGKCNNYSRIETIHGDSLLIYPIICPVAILMTLE